VTKQQLGTIEDKKGKKPARIASCEPLLIKIKLSEGSSRFGRGYNDRRRARISGETRKWDRLSKSGRPNRQKGDHSSPRKTKGDEAQKEARGASFGPEGR